MRSRAVTASTMPRSKSTGRPSLGAVAKKCMARESASSAKAARSVHGSAGPPISACSRTICRPGSGKTRDPRRASSAMSADLPPPEQPETTTRLSLPATAGLAGS